MKVSLCYLFNAALDQSYVLSDLRKGLIVPIFKEGDKEVASKYRGITLLSIVGKLFATIVEKRLSKWCEDRKIFEQEQAGFRAGRSTVNHIFTLAEIIKRKKREGKPTYACFLDIKKAYNTVWREGLWDKLQRAGIQNRISQVIKNMYSEVKSSVVLNDRMTEWFNIEIGLRQGCVLSPLLFLIFINDLLRRHHYRSDESE